MNARAWSMRSLTFQTTGVLLSNVLESTE